jgi:hypothetical protein
MGDRIRHGNDEPTATVNPGAIQGGLDHHEAFATRERVVRLVALLCRSHSDIEELCPTEDMLNRAEVPPMEGLKPPDEQRPLQLRENFISSLRLFNPRKA